MPDEDDGELEKLISLIRTEIRTPNPKLKEEIALTPKSKISDIYDSMDRFQIALAVEDEYEIQLRDDELPNLTVGDILTKIRQYRESQTKQDPPENYKQ